MARIDIKGISKLRDHFCEAALAFSDAHGKSRMRTSAATRSIRVEEAKEAFNRMLNAAIDLVAGLATASDGKDFRHQPSIESWASFMAKNDSAFAAALRELKKKPYAIVFAAAEKVASR